MDWLRQGLTPRQLAFTLALGFAIGCIPLLGVTTAICTLLALLLRLNMPAIQAANWLAMPLQVVLLIPFLRMGHWLFSAKDAVLDRSELFARLQSAPWHAMQQMSGMLLQAVVAWLITVAPACLLLALLLTAVFSRLPRMAEMEAGD